MNPVTDISGLQSYVWILLLTFQAYSHMYESCYWHFRLTVICMNPVTDFSGLQSYVWILLLPCMVRVLHTALKYRYIEWEVFTLITVPCLPFQKDVFPRESPLTIVISLKQTQQNYYVTVTKCFYIALFLLINHSVFVFSTFWKSPL